MAKPTGEEETTDAEQQEAPPDRPETVAEPEALPASPLAAGRLAFYAGEYADAASLLQTVLADGSYDADSRAKAAYWMAEALLQAEYSPDKEDAFLRVAEEFPEHYLASAALRRVEALRLHFAAFEEEQAEDEGD
jgi:TolA-binding protein